MFFGNPSYFSRLGPAFSLLPSLRAHLISKFPASILASRRPSEPARALDFRLQTTNCRTMPRKMNPCAKSCRNRFAMNTYRIAAFKAPLESTLTKKWGGGAYREKATLLAANVTCRMSFAASTKGRLSRETKSGVPRPATASALEATVFGLDGCRAPKLPLFIRAVIGVDRSSCRVAEGFGPDEATTTGPAVFNWSQVPIPARFAGDMKSRRTCLFSLVSLNPERGIFFGAQRARRTPGRSV